MQSVLFYRVLFFRNASDRNRTSGVCLDFVTPAILHPAASRNRLSPIGFLAIGDFNYCNLRLFVVDFIQYPPIPLAQAVSLHG